MFDSFLTLFVLVVVLGLVSWLLLGRREGTGRKGAVLGYRRRSKWRNRMPVLLMVVAVAFLALAFTQFQFLRQDPPAGSVMLAMDSSDSMDRDDVEPTRFEAAKAAARVFLEQFPPDLQVGLVSFAGEAAAPVPPTLDRTEVEEALEDLQRGRGTVIGDGLSLALDQLEAEWERDGEAPGAVVLLSDGRDQGSVVSPEDSAARARDLDVPVYTVVVGRGDDEEGRGADVALMQGIADTTGGTAHTSDTAAGLIGIYETLQTEISTQLDISDYGALFVGIAAVFAIAATVAMLFALRAEY
jgi:Ca-activated chloride channel family protein